MIDGSRSLFEFVAFEEGVEDLDDLAFGCTVDGEPWPCTFAFKYAGVRPSRISVTGPYAWIDVSYRVITSRAPSGDHSTPPASSDHGKTTVGSMTSGFTGSAPFSNIATVSTPGHTETIMKCCDNQGNLYPEYQIYSGTQYFVTVAEPQNPSGYGFAPQKRSDTSGDKNIVPPNIPFVTPSSLSEQRAFDDCIHDAISKTSIMPTVKGAGGVLLFSAGIYVAVEGIPTIGAIGLTAAQKSAMEGASPLQVLDELKAAGLVALAPALLGAQMVSESSKEGQNEAKQLDGRIKDCESRHPSAEHRPFYVDGY